MLTRRQLYELYYEGPEATIHLIEHLLEELADQERILGRRQQRLIDVLRERNERQARQLKGVKEKLWRQESLNYQLRRRVRELQAELQRREAEELSAVPPRRDSHNSSLPPALDLPSAKAANSVRRTRSLRRKSGLKVGGQTGHPGATLLRVERPDRVVTHSPNSCRRCAASLSGGAITAVERRQVFDVPPVRVEVTEHQVETRRCIECGERTKAEFPRGVRAPAQYGEGVRARATYLHKYQLLPFARTSESMKELFGCPISQGTLFTTRGRCAAKLVGVEERIKRAIREAAVIGADETGLRVGGSSHWVHVARTAKLTHYGYDAKRGLAATDVIGILPQFQGTCVRDGWLSYDEYRQCRHALCNAHLLRELIYVEEVSADQKPWTRAFIKLLLEIKAAAEKARDAGDQQLSEEQRAKFLTHYDRLLRRAVRINPRPRPRQKQDPAVPKFKVARARWRSPVWPLIRRLQGRRDEVLRFMTDLAVPFDNNGSERDLRMVKLQQKISGCFRTAEGAAAFCRIRSYLSTARKQGHSVLAALERAFKGKPLALNGL